MVIEKAVLERLGVTQYEVIKDFHSRRNKVCLIRGKSNVATGIEFVYKQYIAGNISREYEYLHRLNGLHVPCVLTRGETALALNYIEGQTLLERLEYAESHDERFEKYIDAFVDFLTSFYTALPGYLYGDVNLRNFIVTNKGVSGVDLEETEQGEAYTDIGRAAAYILTYCPSYTDYKKKLTEYIIETGSGRFGFKKVFAWEAMEAEIKAMYVRRNNKNII